eukprot:2422069-Ditylum_brightwellii.AAC.1
MEKYEVEYIDLSLVNKEWIDLRHKEDKVQDRGDFVRVVFDVEEQAQRSIIKRPKNASLEEFKVAFVTYLQENKPSALACQ